MDSNHRPSGYEPDKLPTALLRYKLSKEGGVEPLGLESLSYPVFSDMQLLCKA